MQQSKSQTLLAVKTARSSRLGSFTGRQLTRPLLQASGMTWWVVRGKGGKLTPYRMVQGERLSDLPEPGPELAACLTQVTGELLHCPLDLHQRQALLAPVQTETATLHDAARAPQRPARAWS